MILLVVAAFAALALFEAPGLLRRRWWRELAVFGVLWAAALTWSVWLTLNYPFPWVTWRLTMLLMRLTGGTP